MEEQRATYGSRLLNHRKKRIKRLKACIVILVATLLVLPTILCILLFIRLNKLEEQLKVLKVMHSGEYEEYDEPSISENGTIVHAAGKDDLIPSNQDVTESEDERVIADVDKEELPTEVDTAEEDVSDTNNVNNIQNLGKSNTEKPKESKGKEDKRKVYLTFDDGPSIYTDEILDILDEYNVKATFFVLGKTDKQSIARYKRIVKEGHTLGMHSYSHRYDYIYKSTKNFKKDFDKISDLLYEVTGVRPVHYRFPGGSSNTVSKVDMKKLIALLKREQIVYHDWNVESGDAASKPITEKKLIKNVMDGIGTKKVSVVLMHDTSAKVSTVKALPKLIKKLKDQGFEILPIDEHIAPVQHIKADSVK